MSSNVNVLDNDGKRNLAFILDGAVVMKLELNTLDALTILSGPTAVDVTHINDQVEIGDVFDIKTASFLKNNI